MTTEDRKAKNREYHRAYRAANRERLQAQQKAWREANPERNAQLKREWLDRQTTEQKRAAYDRNRDKIIAKAAKWNRDNPERRSAITRKSSAKHREARAAYARQWNALNQDRLKVYAERYKQWQRKTTDLDAESFEYAMRLYGEPCSYCGEPSSEVDHIEPVSRGGINHWSNLTSACRSCNARKHAKPMLAFLLTIKG